MRLTTLQPHPALRSLVQLYWHLNGRSPARRERVLPNGVVELIFNLGSPHLVVDLNAPSGSQVFREAWVAGVQRGPLVIASTLDSHLFGVRLRPEGARVLLTLPMSELTDVVVEADAVVGERFAALREGLLEAPSARGCADAADAHLLRRLRAGDAIADPAIAWVERALAAHPSARIEVLSRRAGLSPRRLRERFAEHVGVSPKTVGRVYRLQRAISLARRPQVLAWADLASAAGFSDQPHMIREFRALTHASPAEYLRLRDEDENHMHLA